MTGFHAIVLAAGAGSRFGGGKLLADWRGLPLVRSAVESALSAPVDEVATVLGSRAADIIDALAPIADRRLRIVVADDWSEGLAASLRAGIAALPAHSKGVLIFLGDMPLIPAETVRIVLTALQNGAVAVQPHYRGAPGHPVGIAASLFGDLLTLQGDTGAGRWLKSISGVVRVESDARGCVIDIDRPEDLRRERSGATDRL